MEPTTDSKSKALKTSDPSTVRTSITCSKMPDSLFDATIAKGHFCKFGRVIRILLKPKKQMCIVEYDTRVAAERALLNAGAYDGLMFNVTWTKQKRKKIKKDDDPEWVPDSDVEEELNAMVGTTLYRSPRKQAMQEDIVEDVARKPAKRSLPPKARSIIKKPQPRVKSTSQANAVAGGGAGVGGRESPAPVIAAGTSLGTAEAAAELRALRGRLARTPDDQRRLLDARDRILRAWGGCGARVKVGGAIIGTCPDMCPEKERLQRQAEHQVMNLEAEAGGEGMSAGRAVKQYSRSSADQETPMCYELRGAGVLARTMAYLLNELADTDQVSLADWFHFMWDRCRGIRKDITQQALCCAESVRLVEQCARFHAHCAARLADLEHAQFDQRLNTDNLTKCLQSLKHMYADLPAASKPRESEFRGYVALLNLGDANFWWEIKNLPLEIQKSAPITLAIEVFTAIDNNNYIRFFRLVREKATYLQACILLRYFNDVRARALARIVKAFAPRGGSRYPAMELKNALAFESLDNMKAFITHYGLRMSKVITDDEELSVILDRNQFIEDSDPYPISRSIELIESKRTCSVGEIIAGGSLPSKDYQHHVPHSSFTEAGVLKEIALVAEDQGYSTLNDSNKDINALKQELKQSSWSTSKVEPKPNLFAKPIEAKQPVSKFGMSLKTEVPANVKPHLNPAKMFSFQPAIPCAVKTSPEKVTGSITKTLFSFSKPQDSANPNLWTSPDLTKQSVFGQKFQENASATIFGNSQESNMNIFRKINTGLDNQNALSKPVHSESSIQTQSSQQLGKFLTGSQNDKPNLFAKPDSTNLFSNPSESTTLFKTPFENKNLFSKTIEQKSMISISNKDTTLNDNSESTNVFRKPDESNIFAKTTSATTNIFSKPATFNPFNKPDTRNILSKPTAIDSDTNANLFKKESIASTNKSVDESATPKNLFGQPKHASNIFSKPQTNLFASADLPQKGIFQKPGENKLLLGKENQECENKSIFGGVKANTNLFANLKESQLVSSEIKSPSSLFKSAVSGSGSSSDVFKRLGEQVTESSGTSLPTSRNDFSLPTNIVKPFGGFTQAAPHINFLTPDPEAAKKQQEEAARKEEERRIAEQKKLEEQRRMEEQKRLDEEKKERERVRQEELKKRQEEERRKQEELKKKIEEEKKLAELKRIAEEKRKEEEARRKAEEERKRLIKIIDDKSKELAEDLTNEINNEVVNQILAEEMEIMKHLNMTANKNTLEILEEICTEICILEMKAAKFRTTRVTVKYFNLWFSNYKRNKKRRDAVNATPVWISDRSPEQESVLLRRRIEPQILSHMRAFHRGHVFGMPKQPPANPRYKLLDIVKTSLLRQMQRTSDNHKDCIFWKLTLSTPSPNIWLKRKIELYSWAKNMFSDDEKRSNEIIYLKKESWNGLINFAMSISLTVNNKVDDYLAGTNGILFFGNEDDSELANRIQSHFNVTKVHQSVPVALIVPKTRLHGSDNYSFHIVGSLLQQLVDKHVLSAFRVFLLQDDVHTSLYNVTKSALKWLARNRPKNPSLLFNTLNETLVDCLGSDLWYRFGIDKQPQFRESNRDINFLVQLYNSALDKVNSILTGTPGFTKFPEEFKPFLYENTPYPRSYEYIPSNFNLEANNELIKCELSKLRLSLKKHISHPNDFKSLERDIENFCISNYHSNAEDVAVKALTVLPEELCIFNVSNEEFSEIMFNYEYRDMLKVLVGEKLKTVDQSLFCVYDKGAMSEYMNTNWWYDLEPVRSLIPKAIEYDEDDLECFIEAKRMKMSEQSQNIDMLCLEDSDVTLVNESIKTINSEIESINRCSDSVKHLEAKLLENAKKSSELEELLRHALKSC